MKLKSKNKIAKVFSIMAINLFVGGFVLGIVEGNAERVGRYNDFNYTVMEYYWGAFFLSGMLFLAISEVIKLLTEANERTRDLGIQNDQIIKALLKMMPMEESILCSSCGKHFDSRMSSCPHCGHRD